MQERRNVLARLSTRGLIFFLIISFLTFSIEAQAAVKPAPKPSPGPKPQATSATAANAGGGVRVWLDAPRTLTSRAAGTSVPAATTPGAQAQPLALAAGDFDEDGVQDLVAAYGAGTAGSLAIYRGNLDAFAPQSKASFDGIAKGQFPDPFLSTSVSVNLPVRPDFVAVGDFNGDGHLDVAVGSRSSATLYILFGDGKGNFTQPMAVALPAGVTAMAAKRLDPVSRYTNLVIAVSGDNPRLLVYAASDSGPQGLISLGVSAPVTSVAFGNLDRDSYLDAALVAGGQLMILHGRDVHAASLGTNTNVALESVPLVSAAISVAIGKFLPDRDPRSQMAVLSSDGSIQMIARAGLDARPRSAEEVRAMALGSLSGHPAALPPLDPNEGWTIAETFPARVSSGTSSRTPILMTTRISGQAMDDIVVLDGNASRLHLVSHANVRSANDLVGKLPPSAEGDLALTSVPAPVAAIRVRVNIDGRPGVVMLNEGHVAPSVMMPLPDPTFTVNTTTDLLSGTADACLNAVAGQCSLRQAIKEANATVGVDTIMVPAGTYQLTLTGTDKETAGETNDYGALTVFDGVNIVGAVDGSGNPTTIIQAGTTNANGIDKVFSINPNGDLAFDTNFSNLTIRFGKNPGSFGGGLTLPHGFGGGVFWEANGTSTMTMTNCMVTDNSTVDGDGGGISVDDLASGTAVFTLTNSTVQNNTVNESSTGGPGIGGGIFVGSGAAIVINNSQILSNNATQTAGAGGGQGGGIFLFNPSNGNTQSAIHASTVSGNHAAGQGGGIRTGQGLLIDQGTIISNNTVSAGDGGGLCSSLIGETTTLSKVTITGNTASGQGGGILTGSAGGTSNGLAMTFSRLAGNTAPTGNNLSSLGDAGSTVTVTNNWWGTNAASGTIHNGGTGTVTFDPFIVLTYTGSPNKIRINQSSTLTGDMSNDNHGSGAALAANLDVLNGLPITFNNAVLGTIPQAQPEALSAGAQATATYNAGSVGGNGSADATVDQATVTANIVVLQPPSITKSFSPTTVAVNAPSTITFAIDNSVNTVPINASFTDTLPANLVVATTPSVVNSCGGTVTAVAGSGSVSFLNASLAVGACSITVNVQSATDNVYNNSVTINSTDAGTGAQSTSSASLTVINPPTIAKVFGAATIPLNGTTSLTFTLTSTNANLTLNGVAFTDNLPAGLVVATPSNLNSTCSGTATAVDGSTSVSLSGASLAPGASCTVSVNVTGTTPGVKNNSVQVTSTNGGTGNTSNASITVVSPPVIIKAFGAASIPLSGSTSLTFTIQNNNTTTTLTGIGFSDTLPAGLVVSTPNGQTGTCGGGTISATQATNVISLTGATLSQSSSCTFSVNVTGTAAGTQNNTTGNVTSTEGGTGGTASASISVVAPPSIAKAFGAAAVPLNGTTSLTFTITNPAANAVAETGVAFTDTLPAGIVVATPNGLTNTCGGTATAVAGSGSISLTGGTIAASSTCTVTVNVTGTASGQYTNTSGSVTSTNGGTGNTATANLTVASPPTITKAFGAASIPLNGSTSLTFNITNPAANTIALTGVAFTDNLPAGLVVATPNGLASTCGGTATAVAGASALSLAGATLATNTSCTLSVNVTGTTAGVKNNSVQVTATESGVGNTSNASITVASPPVIIKAFGAASIPLSGSTSLTFTIQNNNTTTTLTGIGFSDTLPAGLVISTPNGLTGSCGGGTISATQATNVISLTGATLAQSSSCTFSVNVTGASAGTKNNTTGNVTSAEGGTGGTASASINVVAPPSIAKVFTPSTIVLNATTSLTFTITNPAANAVAETGVAFTDTLPAGIVVATPNGLTNTCGGTATAVAGSGSISPTGGTIAAGNACTVTVNVTGTSSGNFTNTTGNVTSTNGGTGNTATANLSVATPPTITKAFGAASILLNGSTSLTFSINNPNTTLALTGVAFSDALPAGLVVATPNGLTGSCGGGAITATAGSSSATLSGATLAASASCTFSVNVTGTTVGVKSNTTGAISAAESGPGTTSNTATITVIAPPSIAKSFGAASINVSATTTLSFTITNPNATVALTGVAFSDTLPAGLAVVNPNGLTGSCGAGTITAVSGSSAVSLSGGTIAAGGSCTFSVNVTGVAGGNLVNTTGTVTSTNAGTGNTATASITVLAPDLTITKTHTGTFAQSGTGSYTIAVANAGTGPTLSTVTVIDSPATGLTVTAISGTGWTCTLATRTCTRADVLAASASYPTITVTVNIAGNAATSLTNTATVSGGGELNTANDTAADVTTIAPGIVITAVNGLATVSQGGVATFSFSVTEAPGLSLGTITFSCSGLPAGAVCIFAPPSVTSLPAQVALTISTSTLGVAQNRLPGPLGGLNYLFTVMMLPFLGLVPMGAIKDRRNRKRVFWLLLIVFALLLLAGCGFHPSASHPVVATGQYNITVTATSSVGGVQAQSVVTLIVQ
jgi:CSLREA domain-containing protein